MSFFHAANRTHKCQAQFLLSLSGDLIILQFRLKQKKKKVNCGIHVSFTLILMKLFLTHFVLLHADYYFFFLPIFGYLTYWIRINNCCVKLIHH